MNDKNFDLNKLGENISKVVEDAINAKDFKELNQTITDSINKAVDGISHAADNLAKKAKDAKSQQTNSYQNRANTGNPPGFGPQNNAAPGDSAQRSASTGRNMQGNNMRGRQYTNSGPINANSTAVRNRYSIDYTVFAKNPPGNVAGTIQSFFGYLFGLGFGITFLVFFILLLTGAASSVALIFSLIFLPLTVGGIALAARGTKNLALYKRFIAYRDIIGTRQYIEIKELASKTGRSFKKIVKDLNEMQSRRMFLQASFTQDQEGFILTKNAESLYIQALATQKEKEERINQSGMTDEAKEVIETGYNYLHKIKEANSKLPGDLISQKLGRLEIVIGRIMAEVNNHPRKTQDLHKFMNYYLPTTWKLIETYMEFDAQPIQTKNMTDSKKEIENTLDTIGAAFETLLDELFEEQSWSIQADISVLESMLRQEGLSGESPLNKVQARQEEVPKEGTKKAISEDTKTSSSDDYGLKF